MVMGAAILLVLPAEGGVAHVATKVAREFRRQGRDVREIVLAETAAPAWTGLWAAAKAYRQIKRTSVVHIEFGRTATAPFWFAALAVLIRGDVVLVAHDAPTLVDAPGAAVMPAKVGWRDAIAHKVAAPLLNNAVTSLVRRRAGAVAVLSETAAQRCKTAGMRRVGIIGHGADAPLTGQAPSASDTIVFGGFLSPAKGLEDLLDAWSTIGDRRGYRLLIAGTASRQHAAWVQRLRDRSASFPNPPEWLGYLDDHAFDELIANAAVVVLPYRSSNPASGILVRSMVQGRAILATRVTAMESLIEDGITGRLVEIGDTAAMADTLNVLIADDKLRDQLGAQAARVAAMRHTWLLQTEDLDRIYAIAGRAL
ncbi:glycosyltransferase family 4 protein [Actinoplanes sp. URMC 104]|uniref:glycosyltransferase family 4 protein n=1 Tax=Actinoplanes sp. URMC 104 TaxID=3423409 RepID=UPI003F1C172F